MGKRPFLRSRTRVYTAVGLSAVRRGATGCGRALRCVPCAWPWLEARLSAFLTDFFLAPVDDSAIEPAMEPRREEGARGEEGASDRGEEGASDRGEEGASDWARAGGWKA